MAYALPQIKVSSSGYKNRGLILCAYKNLRPKLLISTVIYLHLTAIMAIFTESKQQINNQFHRKKYSIWDALLYRDLIFFKSLIKTCDPNQVNEKGETLAFVAAKHGQYKFLELLIDIGARIEGVVNVETFGCCRHQLHKA